MKRRSAHPDRQRRFARWSARSGGIRTKVLAIALVPSLVLLIIGVGATTYLVDVGQHAKEYAQRQETNLGPTREMVAAIQQERMLSLRRLAGEDVDPSALAAARTRFDNVLAALVPDAKRFQDLGGTSLDSTADAYNQVKTALPLLRAGVDVGAVPIVDVYTFFGKMLDGFSNLGMAVVQRNAPDANSAIGLTRNIEILHVVESMSRASSLTGAAVKPEGLPPALSTDYHNLVGYYHSQITFLQAEIDGESAQRIKEITTTPAWQQVTAMEDAIIRPVFTKSATTPVLPMSIEQWRDAATEVSDQLMAFWVDQNLRSQRQAAEYGDRTARNSLLAGSAVVVLVVLTFALSLLLAGRLIGRLKRLRTETIALAEVQLPETMRRLGAGEPIDPETEAAHLDFGDDEIGSVAKAFNGAHTAAVSAAITEARTREGVRAVFLNIAHRSQVVAHRQLEVLDEAESKQENPEMLEILFRLDHLATRERRNAENLVILGGGQPGRRWRRPVPLVDLARSAAAETVDYARVHTGKLPQIFVIGSAVADLIHLLAELVDNATSFSPPQARVEITGNMVGKGVVVEISDQGIGMAPEDVARANEMLANPPHFGVAALSVDSRLGLFVVAQLGVRHGISVRLGESDYGGIRAVVLIPSAVITSEAGGVDHAPHYLSSAPDLAGARTEVPGTGMSNIAANTENSSTATALDSPRPHVQHAPSLATEDDRPALTRRTRQASVAPEPQPDVSSEPPRSQSAAQARDLFSAIENGTRQGRRATPDPYPSSSRLPTTPPPDRQDGDGDIFYRK
ncbi:sensor histidine kinase [Nocardia alba]|uniref:histidine kinase n=1 Tax=Nocardia alba TaxID=225051 RepID=A0A4R1FR05_9NOCA|nr:nitrate- and nitrite sensing domain-containing protein [Nocardia alba]TCJ97716.1 signal transduction histidine kinase [Nocardia alba]